MKTTLNGLPLYEDDDPMDMRDGYNRAMTVLDAFMSRVRTKMNDVDNILDTLTQDDKDIS